MEVAMLLRGKRWWCFHYLLTLSGSRNNQIFLVCLKRDEICVFQMWIRNLVWMVKPRENDGKWWFQHQHPFDFSRTANNAETVCHPLSNTLNRVETKSKGRLYSLDHPQFASNNYKRLWTTTTAAANRIAFASLRLLPVPGVLANITFDRLIVSTPHTKNLSTLRKISIDIEKHIFNLP